MRNTQKVNMLIDGYSVLRKNNKDMSLNDISAKLNIEKYTSKQASLYFCMKILVNMGLVEYQSKPKTISKFFKILTPSHKNDEVKKLLDIYTAKVKKENSLKVSSSGSKIKNEYKKSINNKFSKVEIIAWIKSHSKEFKTLNDLQELVQIKFNLACVELGELNLSSYIN